MARTYKVTFSKGTTTVNNISEDGKSLVPQEMPLIDVEKGILKSLVKLSAGEEKDLEALNVCIDFLKQIEDADESVTLDSSDIETIKKGFALSAGKRPEIWMECVEFLKQLEKPEEIK